MGTAEERIIVTTEHRDLTKGGIKKFVEEVTTLGDRFAKTTKTTTKYLKNGIKVEKITKNMKKTFKEFDASLLSVMFGATALSGAFIGLVAPSLDAAGVFETLKDTLEIAFLDTGLKVEDWAIRFQELLLGLSDEVRTGIGDAFLLTGGFFALLALDSQLNLFFNGLIGKATSLTTLFSTLSKGVSIALILSGIKEFEEGGILRGIADILLATGFLLPNKTLKGTFAALSLVVSAVDTIAWGGHKSFLDMLKDVAAGGMVGFAVGGVWGAGLGALLTLFVDVVLNDTTGLFGGETPSMTGYVNPLTSQQGSSLPSGVSSSDIAYGDYINTNNINIDVGGAPSINIDWTAIADEIARQINTNTSQNIANITRR